MTPLGFIRGVTNTLLLASADKTLLNYNNINLPNLNIVYLKPKYNLLKRYLNREK